MHVKQPGHSVRLYIGFVMWQADYVYIDLRQLWRFLSIAMATSRASTTE